MIQRNDDDDDDFLTTHAEADSAYADAPASEPDDVADAFWKDALDRIN
jgi:hypothetical protein